MIKKIFVVHVSFIVLCAIGVITSFILALWEITSAKLSFKLGITFMIGATIGWLIMIIMSQKYIKKDLM